MSDKPKETTATESQPVKVFRSPMRKALRIIALSFGVLFVLLALVVTVLVLVANNKLKKRWNIPAATISVPTDEASVTEGVRLLTTRGCLDCHGDDLGGKVVVEAPIGTFYGPNLTKGSGGMGHYRDEDWVRALRHCVAPDGRPLVFMPCLDYAQTGSVELGRMVAALRAARPVDRERKETSLSVLGKALYGAGIGPFVDADKIDHTTAFVEPPAVGPSPEYGKYLSASCTGCHGAGYSGGKIPGAPDNLPVPSNITPDDSGIGKWTMEQFRTAIREGRRPDGRALDPFMPWKNLSKLTDDEVSALYAYLRTVPKKPTGTR